MSADVKISEQLIKENVEISGLDCPDCALKVEKAIKKLPGVKDAVINYTAGNMHVEYNPNTSSRSDIFAQVKSFGYEVGSAGEMRNIVLGVKGPDSPRKSFWLSDKRSLTVLISGLPLILGGLLELLAGQSYLSIALLAVTIAVAGYRPAKSSVSSVRARVFDMNVLMTVAVIGAVILGEWVEGATVMFLYAFGTMLEAYTMDKTRHAIHGLMELAPSEAAVKHGDHQDIVPIEDVRLGDIVIVKPGERIPVDGKVVFGQTSVNQSAITGESFPALKEVGGQVYAGTLNNEGYIEVETSRRSKDSAISHIIHLVEEAQAKKAPSQRFIDKFSVYYTPAVIGIAIAIAILPPLFGQPFTTWFYRALVLLVIACPCALVISTPVSIASAIGSASRNGVLIKGGTHLETVGQTSAVVFDKTGTLTTGKLAVTDVVPLNGYMEDDILAITAAIEARSGHPLAEAVTEYVRERGLDFPRPHNFESMPGKGLKADVGGTTYYVGNPRLFAELGIYDTDVNSLVFAMQREGKTVFMLGTDEKLLGIVAVADKLRGDARQMVRRLRDIGIANVIMLTGDNKATAEEIASQVGITDFRAELLPDDKVKAIEDVSAKYGRVVMVGDGVNDAPAISRADVGIAMGAIGSDIALETSDIALMADELQNIPYTIRLSRRALKIIKQNIAASIIVKLGFIALAVGGFATLWMAVFADTGISVLVILNGMRLFSRKI